MKLSDLEDAILDWKNDPANPSSWNTLHEFFDNLNVTPPSSNGQVSVYVPGLVVQPSNYKRGKDDPQHMQALEVANRKRKVRADVKRAVKERVLTVQEVLKTPADELDAMPIGELLEAQQRWGEARVSKFLRRCQIGYRRTIGSLTERQVARLTGELESKATEGRATRKCPSCGNRVPRTELKYSLWGNCNECDMERLRIEGTPANDGEKR